MAPLYHWLIRRPRALVRDAILRGLDRVATSDDGRAILVRSLGGFLPTGAPRLGPLGPLPFGDVGRPAGQRLDPTAASIMITARFRSGSTLLWQLFRHVGGCTAYYEPFNERRWFDPSTRGDRVDPTHLDIDNYWSEYEGLEVLGRYYNEDWIRRHLYMDETSWDPGMVRYVQTMIDAAPGRPVLQFNRVDFRLAWLRHHFPDAIVVHLYRHPRDHWWSIRRDSAATFRDDTVENFRAQDKFYLFMWVDDLKLRFPFLEPSAVSHPYQLCYYVWRLSHLFGQRYAHFSIAYEDILAAPQAALTKLFDRVGIVPIDLTALVAQVTTPSEGWRRYADEAWFRDQEAECEEVLTAFFGTAKSGPRSGAFDQDF